MTPEVPPVVQTLIDLIAVISWEGQSNDIPEELHSYIIYDGDETDAINNIIEGELHRFAKYQMFFAQRDQGQIVDLKQTPQDRIAVPLHWVVCLRAETRKLGAELSETGEDGKERFADGSTPLLN
jgi:hypothetical protein